MMKGEHNTQNIEKVFLIIFIVSLFLGIYQKSQLSLNNFIIILLITNFSFSIFKLNKS